MGNCLKSCLRTENPRISRNQCDPSKATTKSGMSSAPSAQTACSTLTTPTVPSYTRGSTRDYIPAPPTEGEILSCPNLKAFTFNELKSATRNFRPDSLIGEGGFGYVFKGWIDEQTLAPSKPGAGMVVAVKKLKPKGFQGHSEWLTEVRYLGQLHHPNLVKLIGFCLDGDNRLLVYEYMPKGSLENHLFRRGPQPLSWDTRMKVAIGAAKGLTFLHDAKSQVIYRDLKSSNILLDSDFHAKLSDFGLAKAGPTGDRTHVSTRIIGTQGYAAPEYIATGRLSAKADVYSFGVVLLELLSGRPAYEKSKSGSEQSLVDWARPYLYDKRKLFLIMDSKLEGKFPKNVAHAMVNLVLVCIGNDPKLRPRMSEVLAVLEKLQDPKAAEKLIQTERAKSSKKSTKRFHASALQSTQGASPHRQTPGGGSPLQQIPGGSPLRQTPRGSPHRPTHRSPRRPTSGRSPLPSNTRSPRVH